MTNPIPPVARRVPTERRLHGGSTTDDFTWMTNGDDPLVLDYLQSENRYTDLVLEPTKQLREKIYHEIKMRVVQTDVSAEVPNGEYTYFTRTSEGSAYAIHCRRRTDGTDGEEVILDENELAAHEKYLVVGAVALSPNQQFLAYTTDNQGSEHYEMHFKNLTTNGLLDDIVELVSDDIAWADNQTIFYTSPDELLRPWQVWRHRLGTDPGFDQIVFEEPDERFYVGCRASRDRRWIVISTNSVVTSEVRLVECDHPERSPIVVAAKEQGHEYLVEPCGNQLFVLSNSGAPNFRLLRCNIENLERDAWVEILNDSTMRLDDMDAFASHLVVSAQKDGLPTLLIYKLATRDWHELEMDEQA
ncbi:MAG: hypothetical protein ACC652_11480, partial [Acidimicrobiales bacterium]